MLMGVDGLARVSMQRDHFDHGVEFDIDTNSDNDRPLLGTSSTTTKFPVAHPFRMNLDTSFERDVQEMGEVSSARPLGGASGVSLRSRSADNAAGPSVPVSRHKSVTPSRSVVDLTEVSPSVTNITKSPIKSPAKKRSRAAVPAAPLGLMSAGVFANPPQHVVSVHTSPQHTSATTR